MAPRRGNPRVAPSEDLADAIFGAYDGRMSGDTGDSRSIGGGTEAGGHELATALIGSAALTRDIQLAALGLASLMSPPLAPWVSSGQGQGRPVAVPDSARRFRSYFPLLRRWFDLGDDGLSAVLVKVDSRKGWIDAPFPGVRYFRFQSGPAAASRESGCLLLSPGALFPHHLHHGKERSLILEGSLLLDGVPRHVGEVIEAPAGSMHDFVAGPHADLVLIVAHDGLSFSV